MYASQARGVNGRIGDHPETDVGYHLADIPVRPAPAARGSGNVGAPTAHPPFAVASLALDTGTESSRSMVSRIIFGIARPKTVDRARGSVEPLRGQQIADFPKERRGDFRSRSSRPMPGAASRVPAQKIRACAEIVPAPIGPLGRSRFGEPAVIQTLPCPEKGPGKRKPRRDGRGFRFGT